jgi:fructose-1,6-bisphosphatase/inositol monophosphatase family enzyme
MSTGVEEPDRIAGVLSDAAAAVADALAATGDWSEAGTRPGQHHSDLAADDAATAVLEAAGYSILSEESGQSRGDSSVTVVLDPLDGSTNASRGLGWWATSLCAVDEHGPAVALVVDLRHGDRWTARRGEGAARDGMPIHASGCAELSEAIVGLNGVPAGHGGWAQYRVLGAVALDLCAVADGTLDGYLDATIDELGVWDYLGAMLVCREAGATVVDAAGRDLVVLDPGARRIPVAAATVPLAAALADRHPVHGRIRPPAPSLQRCSPGST